MARNLPVVATKKFKDVSEIVATPSNRAKLQNYIDTVIRCKTKILDENESIKGLREEAVNDLGIQPKVFNALVSLYFNNNFEAKKEEIAELDAAIDALMGNALGGDDGDE